jgi:hypothetical protein
VSVRCRRKGALQSPGLKSRARFLAVPETTAALEITGSELVEQKLLTYPLIPRLAGCGKRESVMLSTAKHPLYLIENK